MSSEDALKEIWRDDLLGRKAEAELLVSFLTRISGVGQHREWARAYTLAVDAGYGVGKTFFLRRLERHLSATHHVAYVDAWSDDLQDDPLTALAATLYSAFAELISTDAKVREHWDQFLSKSGKIAKIVGLGLVKRGAGFLITQSAAEAVEATLQTVDMEIGDLERALTESPEEVLKGPGAASLNAAARMRNRISDFRAAQAAVLDLKSTLSSLIAEIGKRGEPTPVFIIIDEIDRCRPTYAIKLFEEVKHLFDVSGLVFVFGMHQDALSHSVAGEYGPGFDGWRYLRRFINKTYRLKEPNLSPLIKWLFQQMGIEESRLLFSPVIANERVETIPVCDVIAEYMKSYGKTARDAHYVVETLQTCLLLTGNHPLLVGYLLPLILSSMDEKYDGKVLEPASWSMRWSIRVDGETVSPLDYITKVRRRSTVSPQDLVNRANSRSGDSVALQLFQITANNAFATDPLAHPKRYPKLLETVARFETPRDEDVAPE